MTVSVEIHHAPELEPAAQTAVRELAEFVRHMTGAEPRLVADMEAPGAIGLGGRVKSPSARALRGLQERGYLWQPGKAGLLLAGKSAKGLLNAVYGFLAAQGVRWPAPGVELLPPPGELRLPEETVPRNPAFPRSGIFGTGPQGEWADWCRWYARLGFSELTGPGEPRAWQAAREVARQYGMDLILGGHGLSALLPRELFEQHPDYFRAGQPPDFFAGRTPDSNLCVGSRGAMARVRQGAKRYVGQHPGARVYHLWADDLPAGGWCFCAKCWGLSPQDQALAATNAVTEGLLAAEPEARAAYLVYHDTLEPPRLVAPHEAVTPLYAPRERCYAHALDDPACPRNRYHREHLERMLEYFGHRPWDLFEYYSDYILFRGMLPLMPELVAADLKYYHSLGLDSAGHLLVGGPVGLLLNLHVVAQQVWDLGADPWAPLRRLAEGTEGLLAAWELQAQASQRWLPICQWPVDRYTDYRFLLERPVAESQAWRAGVAQAAAELEEAGRLLPRRLPEWAEDERLALKTSALICRQMAAQMEMLEEMGRCLGGEKRGQEARAARQEAVRWGRAAGKEFVRGGQPRAYFRGLEPLLESIWKEKVGAEYCREA